MGDDFKEWNIQSRIYKKNKRDRNLNKAEGHLKSIGLKENEDFIWKNDYLIQITIGENKWSFWPSKEKWKRHFGKKKETQEGVVKLKEEIKLYFKNK